MKTQAIQTAPAYYHNYIELAENQPLNDLLPNGGIKLYESHFKELEAIGDKVYAEGKWTIKEIVQHCIDTERIMINRALRFLRHDTTNLPGYDHDTYVPVSNANKRTLASLIEEHKALRHGNALFYQPLEQEELLRAGTANDVKISVLAIGYILIGHPTHHFNVIQERYLNL